MIGQMPKWIKFLIVCFLCLSIAAVTGWLAYHFTQ